MLIAWTFGLVHDVIASFHMVPNDMISFTDGDDADLPILLN